MNQQRLDEIRAKTEAARTGQRLFSAGCAMAFVVYAVELLEHIDAQDTEIALLRDIVKKYEQLDALPKLLELLERYKE